MSPRPDKQTAGILIVDGQPYWRQFAKRVLEDQGYGVDAVSSLPEARSAVKRQNYRWVLVDSALLDSPGTLARLVLSTSAQTGVAVVATADAPEEALPSITMAFDQGACTWIRKPFGREGLIKTIQGLETRVSENAWRNYKSRRQRLWALMGESSS